MRPGEVAFPGAVRPRRALATLVCTALVAGACVERPPETPEAPAPASERRDTLALRVDLPRAQRCEEAFDLRLYQDRGIELIEWDTGRGCEGRNINIRYLPRRTTHEKVEREIQEAGAKIVPRELTDRGPP
jgi:hypothetical protein